MFYGGAIVNNASADRQILDRCRVRYPWAMAPTSNTMKLVATAIATFASTDKFMILPSISLQ
jgi:hypothetical protein